MDRRYLADLAIRRPDIESRMARVIAGNVAASDQRHVCLHLALF